jgi:hypothetical protein
MLTLRDQIQCFETIFCFFCSRMTYHRFIGGQKMPCLCHNRVEVALFSLIGVSALKDWPESGNLTLEIPQVRWV